MKTHRTPKDIREDAAAYVPLQTTRPGEYIRLHSIEAATTYRRSEYCFTSKKYRLVNMSTGESIFRKGDCLVFTGFIY